MLKLAKAILIGVLFWLGSMLLGGVLAATTIPVVAVIGAFMVSWAVAIGVLAFAWYYFFGIPGLP